MELRAVKFRKGFLRGMLPLIRLLPPPAASRFLSGFGRFEYRINRGLRAAFDDAVSKGGKALRCDWDVPRVGERLAVWGLVVMVITFLAGVLAISIGSDWASYVMAAGFLVAAALYAGTFLASYRLDRAASA